VPGEGDKNTINPAAPVAAPSTPVAPVSAARSFFDQHKTVIAVGILILVAIAAGFGLGLFVRGAGKDKNRLVLYGNVDLRQVDLAFNNSERIAEVLVARRVRAEIRLAPSGAP
jgi:hypothetical protein